MVPLPAFKLLALAFRHFSKYGANRIKIQAHDHPRFRKIAERGGQFLHQINLRLAVASIRDLAAERRAREKKEAPTVKTEAQVKAEEAAKHKPKEPSTPQEAPKPKKRKFRPLPEDKAVDLFADFAAETFILAVASALLLWEFYRQKPDTKAAEIAELKEREEEHEKKIKELEEEVVNVSKQSEERLIILEQALESLKASNRTKGRPGLFS